MSDTSKIILKADLPRTRDLSFAGRFHSNYGFEDGLFEYLLNQKDIWGDKLFYFHEDSLMQWIKNGKHTLREVNIGNTSAVFPDTEVQEVLRHEFEAHFGEFGSIDIQVGKGGKFQDSVLNSGSQMSLKENVDRNATVINAGGTVILMRWLPYGDIPYLAVGVINSEDGLTNMVSDPSLSLFGHPNVGKAKSAIQIWRYHPETMSMELSQVLDTSKFGASLTLKWLPMKGTDSDTLGVLLGNFSDGKLHAFKIANHISESTVYLTVLQSSWTISIRDERAGYSRSLLPITCYDFIDNKRVIVGTVDGAIAEFILPSGPTDDDLSEPSFLEYFTDSCINSICVGESHNSHLLFINTATTQAFTLIYENIRQGRVNGYYTISHLPPLYHSGYRIYVSADSAESIGYSFVRHPQEKTTLLLKTEMVSSFHISEYLNHPLALVGNVLGYVYVMNLARKILGVPKANNKFIVPLRMWSVSLKDKKLILNGDYVKVASDKNENVWSFTPPEVVISATAWNESFNGSSTYAFGTYSGLLVVERLDPKT